EFRVPSSEFRVPSSEFRVPSSEFRVSGSGFRVGGFRWPNWNVEPGTWNSEPTRSPSLRHPLQIRIEIGNSLRWQARQKFTRHEGKWAGLASHDIRARQANSGSGARAHDDSVG